MSFPNPFSAKMTTSRKMPPSTPSESTEAASHESRDAEKPRLASALATILGTGYLRPSPGTYGSVVGVATAFLSAVFFLHPASVSAWFSRHPLSEAMFADRHFLVPGSDIRDSVLALPLF